MTAEVIFDPALPWSVLAVAAVCLLALAGYAGRRGLVGWLMRAGAGLVILAALANPSLREEERTPLPDIALLVIDETASQSIAPRPAQLAEAEAALRSALDAAALDPDAPLEWREVRVADRRGDEEPGSYLMTALEAAARELPSDRIAGAILLTDGQVHDADLLTSFPAPVHVLLTGTEREWDRRLIVETAPAFGIVGESVPLSLRIEETGLVPDGEDRVLLTVALDGDVVLRAPVPKGETLDFEVPISRGGQNVLELSVPEGPQELTPRNNTALVTINGVRDRLRVLLVSGEPHPGGRTWRNLLKSDPAVDLVHFTILRPPSKQDGVPVFEMSLIAFPTRELFMEKIDEFDLIIFDRYRRRGVLPTPYLSNIVRYVEEGGAVLVASGPAFAGVESLYRTPLRTILPAAPTARVIEEGFLPRISALGDRHPVTSDLTAEAPRPVSADGTPGWGRWFRMIDLENVSGDTLMQGPEGRPLLVLDRPGEGRIAMLASDHAWLWSRGYEGGGPQQELLRRLAHWLMKEPELEEDVLTAEPDADGLMIERRSLAQVTSAVTITRPDGSTEEVVLSEASPGRWIGRAAAPEDGLYRLSDGDLDRVVAIGPAAPREFETPLSTGALLSPIAEATRGGVKRLSDGIPDIRRIREGRSADGRGWIGLVERGGYRVEDISLTGLAPGWLMLLLTSLLIVGAWRKEGR
ncbi:hypothetical protein FHS89_001119 [Rubricella aquisinus]|uniref:Glutamine amidotransferase domain-containing protein n=1 Tax=Rubricella aquisinus TaxID=2028108 RepID=A0A840WJ39_9RHOB|nr:hypothetical protein [Rubricella aquisinus]MBB5515109.1 hypothetical protein [Rubricella aquisinus]